MVAGARWLTGEHQDGIDISDHRLALDRRLARGHRDEDQPGPQYTERRDDGGRGSLRLPHHAISGHAGQSAKTGGHLSCLVRQVSSGEPGGAAIVNQQHVRC